MEGGLGGAGPGHFLTGNGEGANEGVKGKAGRRGWLLLSAAGSGLELEVWGGLRRPLTWASCSYSGPPGGLTRPGLPDRLDGARCGQGSAELLAPPPPSPLLWVGEGRTDAE